MTQHVIIIDIDITGPDHTRAANAVLRTLLFQRVAGQRDAGVIVRVYRLTEVDGVFELLAQHFLARVARHLEQEEARVALWQEVVWRVVLVQDLHKNKDLFIF